MTSDLTQTIQKHAEPIQFWVGFFMIKKDTVKDTGQTIITICNYDKYNGSDGDKDADANAARTQNLRI